MPGKLFVFILLTTCMLSLSVSGQDPAFSQFYASPMYLNPAMAGSTYCGRLTLNYRNQWPAIPKGYVTYHVAYDQFLEKIQSGYGVMFTADRQGDGAISALMASGLYSFKLQASEDLRIDFGAQVTYQQMKVDIDKLVFGGAINPNDGSVNPGYSDPSFYESKSVGFVDFSAGVYAGYRDIVYGGLAVHHLAEPENGFNQPSDSKLYRKFTAHAGTEFNLSNGRFGEVEEDDIALSPNVLYMQQGEFHQLNAGLYASISPFVAGLWFRHNFENPDAVIILLGFRQPSYQIGYSFDYTLSKIGISSGGSHEVSFRWEFCIYKEDYKKRRIKAIESPNF
ncbi:MAG TPA: PorP/SprF family type IX secretion system membrane protein [Bacteroidales bacterium]|nr:PorP/SprF family type IX secretion system membrane protein [Bacteroidales bacterium]HNS47561.1 PorP/SprF family type IX secretion system membrane protein [Bacteroidales bacterium]